MTTTRAKSPPNLTITLQATSEASRRWLEEKIAGIYAVQPMNNGWQPWLGLIARRFNLTPKQLRWANQHIKDPDHLKTGSWIFIPKSAGQKAYWDHWDRHGCPRPTYCQMIHKMVKMLSSQPFYQLALAESPGRRIQLNRLSPKTSLTNQSLELDHQFELPALPIDYSLIWGVGGALAGCLVTIFCWYRLTRAQRTDQRQPDQPEPPSINLDSPINDCQQHISNVLYNRFGLDTQPTAINISKTASNGRQLTVTVPASAQQIDPFFIERLLGDDFSCKVLVILQPPPSN